MYVQYGCGWSAPETWENFDASPTLRFERLPLLGKLYTRNAKRFPSNVRYGDIIRGLPIPPASCDAIYASHVLEHLALADFRTALRNTLSYLKTGGTFRLVVPDLMQHAQDYIADGDSHRFMRETYLGHETRPRGLKGLVKSALGNSEHLWMWDERSMGEALKEAGFIAIRRSQFGDAHNTMFRAVEDPERFKGCLAMEARRSASQ